jgi:DNA polymerase III subunit gamma/tau
MANDYIVSARKYRPKTFDEVVGQEHITTTLKNAMKNNQLAHSFLFTGPRGIGKTSCARILAKTINCTNQTDKLEACGECASCNSFQDNNSFAIYELDAASNNGVEHIRELTEQVRFAPQGGKYKVYIIDEVHMLSGSAFNAFLKTLEEPPHYAIFILATTEKHKIIPTILSRCQIFDFKRISSKEVVTHLSEICEKESIKYEEDALQLVAQKSEGCMRDALSIMDKVASFSGGNITYASALENLNILDYDYYFKMIESIAMQDVTNTLLQTEKVLAQGFEPDNIISGLTEHYRNLLVCRDKEMAVLLDVTEGIKKKFYQQANIVSYSMILNGISIASNTETNMRTSRNKRLQLELCLIKLCHLQSAVSIVQEGDTLLKKKLNSESEVVYHFRKPEPVLLVNNKIKTKQAAEAKPAPKVEEKATTAKVEQVAEAKIEEQKAVEPIKKTKVPTTSVANEPSSNYGKTKLSALRKIKDVQRKKIEEEGQNKQEPIALTEENIKEPLQLIFDRFIEEKGFYKSSINSTEIIWEDNCLELKAPTLAKDLYEEQKMQIDAELAEHFHHEDFEIKFTEKEPEATVQIKSKRELFEELAVDNKHLLALRDKFGFDVLP